MLLTVIQRGFVHLGMPLYREPVSRGWVGWEETALALASAASQWPLVRCIYNRAQWRGRVDSRSLTARKHALESSDGLCKPVPDQESGNSFSYLVRGILMDCMATLR